MKYIGITGSFVLFFAAQLVFAQNQPTPTPLVLKPVITLAPTVTPTATLTPTIIPSPTNTPTATITGTQSPSATPTFTKTVTLSPTVTSSPTQTSTRTSTLTPTYTPTPGVFEFKVSPKPDAEGKISFDWGVNIPAESVFLKIYTSGFRLARDFEFNKTDSPDYLTQGSHTFRWDAKDEENRPMPPGIYLCFIDINVKKKTYQASSKTEIP